MVEVVGVVLPKVRPRSIDGRPSADRKDCVATPEIDSDEDLLEEPFW